MTRMPGAKWRSVVNVHKHGVREHRGLVLHVQAGNGSPFGWFNNPDSQASSDFWVSRTGAIEQYVETGIDYAFAQAKGNPYYASVETEGFPDTALTPAQVESVAHIYAWGCQTFGWPLTVVDSTTEHGFTWHGVGGDSWGGHPGCPGERRKAQRPQIIARARTIVGDGPAAPSVSLARVVAAAATDLDAGSGDIAFPDDIRPVEAALEEEGLLVQRFAHDGSFDSLTAASYAAWQRHLGFSGANANGVPGAASLTALGAKHGFLVTS